METFRDFATIFEASDEESLKRRFGMDQPHAYVLMSYLSGSLVNTVANDSLTRWDTQGSGVVATRTVSEWLWTAVDPVAALLQPDDPSSSIFSNDSSVEFALQRDCATKACVNHQFLGWNTGAGNVSNVAFWGCVYVLEP